MNAIHVSCFASYLLILFFNTCTTVPKPSTIHVSYISVIYLLHLEMSFCEYCFPVEVVLQNLLEAQQVILINCEIQVVQSTMCFVTRCCTEDFTQTYRQNIFQFVYHIEIHPLHLQDHKFELSRCLSCDDCRKKKKNVHPPTRALWCSCQRTQLTTKRPQVQFPGKVENFWKLFQYPMPLSTHQ